MQAAQEAPQISLSGNNSEADQIALANNAQIIPASVDGKFHNQQPVYPAEAVRRSEQGAVVLAIHVASDGLPLAVDIAQSSGYALLDNAARDAVLKWHFLPAVRDGQPVPFDMALRVVFHLD